MNKDDIKNNTKFFIVNGIEVDLEEWFENDEFVSFLMNDETFINDVSFGFEKELSYSSDEVTGNEVLESVIDREVSRRKISDFLKTAITEKEMDLFDADKSYYFAHCISADFGMNRGVAVQFNKQFDMKNRLKDKYPDYLQEWKTDKKQGDCILEGRVLNLVVKERYWNRPTYDSLYIGFKKCIEVCRENNITKIAMPMRGSGLDKLNWMLVKNIMKDVFDDSGIEILICYR